MKQQSATPILPPFPIATLTWRRARRLFWLVCLLLVVTVVLGRNWDAAWHATHVFETFYSPPHLFILSMMGVATLVVIALICSPSLRACFGPGFQVSLVPFEVPGALFILASGFVVLGFAGLVL